MAEIELLQPGCTAQELIDTVNALIAALTDSQAGSISYNDLTDKPTLNGVEIAGAQTTADLKVKIAETADFATYNDAWATKSYADGCETAAVAAANAAAAAALASKLNADLSNLDAVDAFSGDAYIPVVSGSAAKKTSVANLAAYVETRAAANAPLLSATVREQLRVLALTGNQDGTNTTYACSAGYTLGTSCLYLNGQLLTRGTDYTETSAYQIVMLTHVPVSTDAMVFMAVPLSR